jgi:hypothetical protein
LFLIFRGKELRKLEKGKKTEMKMRKEKELAMRCAWKNGNVFLL